ncbi:MAG TPA: YqaJ viral recombinase family protein [Ilumatobacteraceae bacterium]|nr:YqaJ viral recombinase family protein [Ilumatobacteraceae bacterium]
MRTLNETGEHQDDPAWLAWRAGGITATDVARAATGRYGGIYAVVAEKLGTIEKPPVNDVMLRGHRWQEPIADAVHALTGLYVVGEETWCQHTTNDWCRATVDGFLAHMAQATPDDLLGVLEVKTRGLNVRAAWDYWSVQMQWQMYCTGLDRAVLADAVVDDEHDRVMALHLTEVEHDSDRADSLLTLATIMADHIAAGTLPDPDCPSALDTVKAVTVVADPDAETVDLTSMADDVRRFIEIKAAVKAVTDERDALEARIRAAVGSATVGTAEGLRVSISRPSMVLTKEGEETVLGDFPAFGKVVLDRERLKTEAPDIYDLARQPIGARRLTTKETS